MDLVDTECEKLWKSIRQRYSRERKKVKSERSGSGAKNVTKWAWYDDLTFLDECIQERRYTFLKCYTFLQCILNHYPLEEVPLPT
jgi:hypothetical protein